ncbi:MAG: hypothetical protein ACOYOS_13420 [Syntrophales bacterium]
MPNWDNTTLTCSNTEAVKACATAIQSDSKPFMRDQSDYKEGDTEFYASTAWDVPHEKIKEVSKQFPNDVIVCGYSFDGDLHLELHTVEYRNGEDRVVGIEPSYMSGTIPLNNDKDREAIHDKAVAFCRRLDTTETDKDGKLSLNRFNEEVCYKFEHDVANGKKYRIEATKLGHQIVFKVFEGHIRYDWQELQNNHCDGEDVPF